LRGKRPPDAFVIAENDRPLNGIDLMKKKYPDFDTAQIDRRMRMLRTRSHKLIWYDDGQTEVYDLRSDPEELENIADREPELRDQLVARLEAWAESLGAPAPPATPTRAEMTDPQTREQLRALGYIE
jgi:arylsulfatase A-like enzyme